MCTNPLAVPEVEVLTNRGIAVAFGIEMINALPIDNADVVFALGFGFLQDYNL